MWWAEGPSGRDLHPCITSFPHPCIPKTLYPTSLHPYIPASPHPCLPTSLPPWKSMLFPFNSNTLCHSSQLDEAPDSPAASYCTEQLYCTQPWHLLALNRSYAFTEFFLFLVINGEIPSHNYFPHGCKSPCGAVAGGWCHPGPRPQPQSGALLRVLGARVAAGWSGAAASVHGQFPICTSLKQ